MTDTPTSSYYVTDTVYESLSDPDTVIATINASLATSVATATAAAGASATAAAASATAAANSLTAFNNEYLGGFASAPPLNNTGGALVSGNLYWNTAGNTLYVYNGSTWVAYGATSVATVFGRSGAVVAVSGDYTFAQIGSKPTTISGYGITDGLVKTNNLSDVSSTATARSNLGLGGAAVLGVGTSTGTVAAGDDSRFTSAAQKASNLSDLANASTARSNLGLGSAAVASTGTSGATVPFLNQANTWSYVQSPSAAALTSGAGANFSTNQIWTVTVSGSTFTIANPTTNPPTNSFIGISISFSTTNAVAWGTAFKVTGYTASATGKDFLTFFYNGTTYELVGVRNGTNS